MELDERLALARDSGTPPVTLTELSKDPSVEVRVVVAGRPDAQADVLRTLTRDSDRGVRQAVARNPATSRANLLRLVGDDDRWVRWAVAGNPGCDAQVRQAMVRTDDKELRGLLAESPDLEVELAAELTADRSPEVRERLATNTRHPEIIATLLNDRTVRVRKGLAVNPQTTPDQRHQLATDSAVDVRVALVRAVDLADADLTALVDDRSADVRHSLALSARTPEHIRQALEKDADETVAQAARGSRRSRATVPARRGPKRFVTGPKRPQP